MGRSKAVQSPAPRRPGQRRRKPAIAAIPAKQRGELVEMMFMVKASQQGLAVAKPYGDSRRYDFIADSGEKLWRVQVKSSAYFTRGRYRLCATGSNLGNREVYTTQQIDFLIACVVPKETWYVIPVAELKSRNLNLYPDGCASGGRYEKYREAWHLMSARKIES